jgi:hypothetical protein
MVQFLQLLGQSRQVLFVVSMTEPAEQTEQVVAPLDELQTSQLREQAPQLPLFNV